MEASWIRFALLGTLQREYLLPPQGRPCLDIPGGEVLYAAAGTALWQPQEGRLGLIARTGIDFPLEWLERLQALGWQVDGVHRQERITDSRRVRVYTPRGERVRTGWAVWFAERGYPFPQDLREEPRPTGDLTASERPTPWTLRQQDLPEWVNEVRFAHLTPVDWLTHHLLPAALRQAGVTTITLDPCAGYMTPVRRAQVRDLVAPLTAFLPNEEELRGLFGHQWEDLWNMAEEVASWGVPVVVIKRGREGVWVYDRESRRRWQVPAYPVQRMRDPTGVGSAFAGGFLAGWARTEDPVQAALHGVIAAAVALETCGALAMLDTLPGLLDARLQVLREEVRRV